MPHLAPVRIHRVLARICGRDGAALHQAMTRAIRPLLAEGVEQLFLRVRDATMIQEPPDFRNKDSYARVR